MVSPIFQKEDDGEKLSGTPKKEELPTTQDFDENQALCTIPVGERTPFRERNNSKNKASFQEKYTPEITKKRSMPKISILPDSTVKPSKFSNSAKLNKENDNYHFSASVMKQKS